HDYEPKYYSLPVNESKPVVTPLAPMDKMLADLEKELALIGEEKLDSVALQLNMATAQWKVVSGVIKGPGGERYPYRPTYEALVQRMAVIEREDAEGFKRFEDSSPYLHYYDREDETWNTIWYEDETSLQGKIDGA
ncbi:S-layer homology domain-containing protein, partial [Aduncisulcus paluster]